MECIILDKKIIIPKKMGTRFASYWNWNSLESITINTKLFVNHKQFQKLGEDHNSISSWYNDNCKEWDEYIKNYTPEFLILRNPIGFLQSALLTEINNLINYLSKETPITLSIIKYALNDKLSVLLTNHHRNSHYNSNVYKFFYAYWIQNKKSLKVVHIENLKQLCINLKGTGKEIEYKKEEFN